MPNAAPSPFAHDHLRECLACGMFQEVPPVGPKQAAHCLRCDTPLRRGRSNPLTHCLAFTVAAALMLLLAISLPFLGLRAIGRFYPSTMFTGPVELSRQGLPELGLLVVLCAIVMPAIKLGLMGYVLVGLRTENPPRSLPRAFAWLDAIRPWAMVEVFMLGVFVAFSRLEAIATVTIGPALYAIGACMLLTAAADASLDHEAVWDEIDRRGLSGPPLADGPQRISCTSCHRVHQARSGQECTRCHTVLRLRTPRSMATTWALVLASLVFYLPANLLPVMTVVRYGRSQSDTIMSTVKQLGEAGMWPLAALVFFASIMVPGAKLVALILMMVTTHSHSGWALRGRTRLHRIVEAVGRWSMLDVFLLSTLVALVQIGLLTTIRPESGDIYFAAVVVLTMIAARSFDSRLMWDAAGRSGADLPDSDEIAAAASMAGTPPVTAPGAASDARSAAGGLAQARA